MISFAAPQWALALIPLLVALGWYQRQLRLWEPPRALCLALLVLLLMQPRLHSLAKGLDLWVLVDRSASAADRLTRHLPEWETLIEKARTGADRLRWVDFADAPARRSASDASVYTGDASHTRLAQAIRYAQSQMDASRASRLLVLTDGYSTEPLRDLAESLAQQHVPLDYRLLTPGGVRDLRIGRFVLPPRVQAGEGFMFEAHVAGNVDGPAPYTVSRGGAIVHRGVIQVRNGRGVAQFSDRIDDAGAYPYRIDIAPERDAHPGNNTASGWVETQGSRHVLLISRYPDDPVAAVLQQHHIDVKLVTQPAELHVGHLTGARAVILNNVAAYHLPGDFLRALDVFVRAQGGGLLMAGGKHAFGSGGYYGSAIDPLLPVAMELREEHRQYPVAMAIVLDRSGSMSAGVSGGAGLTKMDLANEGAAEAIALLGNDDVVTVFAVDSRPHLIVPLLPVQESRQHLVNTVRGIRSQGGGIYVYTGLQAAWNELRKTGHARRHIVLFADAADAEEPGQYQSLLRTIRKNGGTVSVIGLGTHTDGDAAFLNDVAKRGEGRIFFSQNPNELPALFAQETVSVARSMFIEKPVGVQATGVWRDLAAEPLAWLSQVDGYNLGYGRSGASVAALSVDDYRAPLTAFWQRGAGRTAAVTFPLAGDFSQRARAWSHYALLIHTLTRWLMGPEQPAGIGLARHGLGQHPVARTALPRRLGNPARRNSAPRRHRARRRRRGAAPCLGAHGARPLRHPHSAARRVVGAGRGANRRRCLALWPHRRRHRPGMGLRSRPPPSTQNALPAQRRRRTPRPHDGLGHSRHRRPRGLAALAPGRVPAELSRRRPVHPPWHAPDAFPLAPAPNARHAQAARRIGSTARHERTAAGRRAAASGSRTGSHRRRHGAPQALCAGQIPALVARSVIGYLAARGKTRILGSVT